MYIFDKLCRNFQTGHVKTSMGSYFIKPTEYWREDDKDSLESSLQHAIYRVPAIASNSNDNFNFNIPEDKIKSHNCGVIGKSNCTRYRCKFRNNFIFVIMYLRFRYILFITNVLLTLAMIGNACMRIKVHTLRIFIYFPFYTRSRSRSQSRYTYSR